MRATITRPDGTRVEAEGTADEIAQLADGETRGAPCLLPHYPPLPIMVPVLPMMPIAPAPSWPWEVQQPWTPIWTPIWRVPLPGEVPQFFCVEMAQLNACAGGELPVWVARS